MRVALVNTNRIRPPIAPLGLEYLAEALAAAGHQPALLDLCWEADPEAALCAFFAGPEFGLVGITLRNTTDASPSGMQDFIPGFLDQVALVRRHTAAPIVLGGVGYSVIPEAILATSQADAGVWGEGEGALPEMASRLEADRDWHDIPGLVWRDGDRIRRNPPVFMDLAKLPPMARRWMDVPRYFREGGQLGFETKRGCAGACIYCADLVAKGRQVRLRPPAAVAAEIAALLAQGADHLHTCDSEFNLPPEHAAAVCEELVRRGLGERVRWYAYCSPAPFDGKLAGLMRRAGCAGINFGADSGDEEMLRRLGRWHTPQDIVMASRLCREQGMAVMLDLLLGVPGESEGSLARTIEVMRRADPDRVGVGLGVGVVPDTPLATMLADPALAGGLHGGPGPLQPQFFLEPAIADTAAGLLDRLIGDDPRFLFFDPSRPSRNYNYNANEVLVAAIRQGARGAYWDILRREAGKQGGNGE